jgi:hypothetical protein
MNGRGKNFMENLNMIMDCQFFVINHLLNNLFKYINILTLCQLVIDGSAKQCEA